MDAGLAAVLGALAGAVATTGAAFATGWSAREQAKMAARAEHLRQRRDARQAVYEEFIAAAAAHSDLTKILLLPVPEDFEDMERLRLLPEGMDLQDVIRESESLHKTLREIATRVQIAGPKEVSAAATVVEDNSREVSASLGVMRVPTLAEIPGWTLSEKWREGCTRFVNFSGAVDEFAEKARIALDNDGTKP
ncbi:hypothetical protein [Streptomyces sp. NPDC047043]|uniref:hypothetical protein n=1 Tax=Streptomyces sp. NPDC047043 TaxID=3154497 RepID=UPI0033D30BD4